MAPRSFVRAGARVLLPATEPDAMPAPLFSRALASRNYRLYFAGQLVSLAGTWMQQIAMVWLAYRLSNSALVLGTVGFASQVPILVLGPLTGVWTDRYDRRRILVVTQSLAMLQATALAILAWGQWASPAALVALAFGMGCINALDVPARQAFVSQLIDDREDLPNAIALNALLMNATRFVGPALAGFAVATIGEAWCFVLNAASYLAVLLALLAIDAKPNPRQTAPVLEAFREALAYIRSRRDIRACLLLVGVVSFLVTPYAVMMPLFAREIFGGDARTYGLLIASAGGGSLAAALYLASRQGTGGLFRLVSVTAAAAGTALACFALNGRLGLAFPIAAAIGFSVILTVAGSNTYIQTRVGDRQRGRVMAVFSMAFLGIAPLGSLAVGSLAHALGVRPILVFCGLATAAAALLAGRRMAGLEGRPADEEDR
ncbi:MAG: MFS transporter [Rhodocyclaceae bacterium]|nr:MFS transporter [Rhodocyclaceae bacterium]